MSYQSIILKKLEKHNDDHIHHIVTFKVGAYLKAKDGRTFYGTNVENAAYSMCMCERASLGCDISWISTWRF